MGRMYIDGDGAKFARKDITLVDAEFSDGSTMESLEPRRLFPVSDQKRYIALLDKAGVEQAVIRDLNSLPREQGEIIEACLEEYYLIPKINRILDTRERFDGVTLYTETDRGPASIEIRTVSQSLKMLGSRVLIRDVNDNRYEIPDVSRLDRHSRLILVRYL